MQNLNEIFFEKNDTETKINTIYLDNLLPVLSKELRNKEKKLK